jgi:YidC/Oxa1 family membrane protein insertase
MFLGRERKELPPPFPRLGMDAGSEPSRKQPVHYFAAIWDCAGAPDRTTGGRPGYTLPPGADGAAAARLYLGPKQAEHLVAFHPEGEPLAGEVFRQVIDFGFFGLIAKLMFVLLKYVQKLIPNWGWALAVFGLLVRLGFWSLNTKTTLIQFRQKDLEPYTKKIQAKYAKFPNDMAKKVEAQKEINAFFAKNGHKPFGGCLPAMLQMPVVFALWSMLQNVFELRHAPWVFWMSDLSSADPYYILPLLMIGTMFAQQSLAPPMGDPAQRKMMMVMPLVTGFFFANLPAGLTIYYLTYNIAGMGQTWWMRRTYKPQPVVL